MDGVTIQMTWSKVAGAAASTAVIFFGGIWLVGSVLLSDIKLDVRELRQGVTEAGKQDAALRDVLSGTGRDLTLMISETREIVAKNQVVLEGFHHELKGLRQDVRELNTVMVNAMQSGTYKPAPGYKP